MDSRRDPAARQLVALLEPVHDDARALARRLARCPSDGDDLFHEAIERAIKKLSTLRDPSSFRAWFVRVLLSVHRNRARRSFWRRLVPLDADDGRWRAVGEDGSEWQAKRESAARAASALARLPAVQREAIVLYELEDMSIEDIAGLQSVSTSAVKSRLARGRARLRRHYECNAWAATPAEHAHPGPEQETTHEYSKA